MQARLLGDPAVIEAVTEGGRVRLVLAAKAAGGILASAAVKPAKARFEDGFMLLLRQATPDWTGAAAALERSPEASDGQLVVEVNDLVRQFGNFTAVNHISFEVRRGEMFGLLGPNGAGKTTTFRMLCGLLAPTHGTLRVAGLNLHTGRAEARQRLGYVAQKFALYGDLSVAENLDFFASAYGLGGASALPGPRRNSNLKRSFASRVASCPAVTSSGSRWRRPCCMSPRSYSWTSLPVAPIRWRGVNSGGASRRWPNKA
jgi:ABC-2 type transport system ATP-binding protein